jgi:hypothetical protein
MLVIASENVAERVFETVNATSFHFEYPDLADVGNKLRALGEGLSAEEFHRFFRPDDSWRKESEPAAESQKNTERPRKTKSVLRPGAIRC